jgi:hypothetical protein
MEWAFEVPQEEGSYRVVVQGYDAGKEGVGFQEGALRRSTWSEATVLEVNHGWYQLEFGT